MPVTTPLKITDIVCLASSSGVITSTQIVDGFLNNLFPTVTAAQAASGLVDYQKVFIKNTHASRTLGKAHIYVTNSTSPNDEIDIGIGTPTDTNGAAVSYFHPLTAREAISLGNIAPGAAVSIWLRRTVTAGAATFGSDNTAIVIEGVTS